MTNKFEGVYLNATFVSLDGLRDVVEMRLDKGSDIPTELKRACNNRYGEALLPHVMINFDTRKYRVKVPPKADETYPEFLYHGVYFEVLGGA